MYERSDVESHKAESGLKVSTWRSSGESSWPRLPELATAPLSPARSSSRPVRSCTRTPQQLLAGAAELQNRRRQRPGGNAVCRRRGQCSCAVVCLQVAAPPQQCFNRGCTQQDDICSWPQRTWPTASESVRGCTQQQLTHTDLRQKNSAAKDVERGILQSEHDTS